MSKDRSLSKVIGVQKEFLQGRFDCIDISIDSVLVSHMTYHAAAGEGDAHYVDVYLSDGTVERIFRPDAVRFNDND